jgi:LPXTG-site transpeptidase (sortase) family protein
MSFTSKKAAYYFSHLLIVVAIVSAIHGLWLLWGRYKPAQLNELHTAFNETEVKAASHDVESPQALMFPSLGLAVPLVEATVVNERWQLSKEAGSYVTVDSGDISGTIIYGHNYPRIFGKLSELKESDTFDVRSNSGVVHQYQVVHRKIVDPDDVDSVLPQTENDLVIYTCTGFLDSKRLVVESVQVS